MNKPEQNPSSRDIFGVPGLESLIDRLEPGMEIDGRIVDTLGGNYFVLRIWGHNILTESNHKFEKFSEVILHVRSVHPKLVFSLRPNNSTRGQALYA